MLSIMEVFKSSVASFAPTSHVMSPEIAVNTAPTIRDTPPVNEAFKASIAPFSVQVAVVSAPFATVFVACAVVFAFVVIVSVFSALEAFPRFLMKPRSPLAPLMSPMVI